METIARMRHAALVRRYEQRHKKAAVDFEKARCKNDDDGTDDGDA